MHSYNFLKCCNEYSYWNEEALCTLTLFWNCIQGPARDLLERSIEDVMCMRLAQHLTSKDLDPLRAWLLDREADKDFLQKTQENFSAFRIAEFAFVIMHEWRKRKSPRSLQQLYDSMQNADIDGHIFCMVWFSLPYTFSYVYSRSYSSYILNINEYVPLNFWYLSNRDLKEKFHKTIMFQIFY